MQTLKPGQTIGLAYHADLPPERRWRAFGPVGSDATFRFGLSASAAVAALLDVIGELSVPPSSPIAKPSLKYGEYIELRHEEAMIPPWSATLRNPSQGQQVTRRGDSPADAVAALLARLDPRHGEPDLCPWCGKRSAPQFGPRNSLNPRAWVRFCPSCGTYRVTVDP